MHTNYPRKSYTCTYLDFKKIHSKITLFSEIYKILIRYLKWFRVTQKLLQSACAMKVWTERISFN